MVPGKAVRAEPTHSIRDCRQVKSGRQVVVRRVPLIIDQPDNHSITDYCIQDTSEAPISSHALPPTRVGGGIQPRHHQMHRWLLRPQSLCALMLQSQSYRAIGSYLVHNDPYQAHHHQVTRRPGCTHLILVSNGRLVVLPARSGTVICEQSS